MLQRKTLKKKKKNPPKTGSKRNRQKKQWEILSLFEMDGKRRGKRTRKGKILGGKGGKWECGRGRFEGSRVESSIVARGEELPTRKEKFGKKQIKVEILSLLVLKLALGERQIWEGTKYRTFGGFCCCCCCCCCVV